jgi:membrane-bound metal-dependent hydrolase YbcI (DUF457 family)
MSRCPLEVAKMHRRGHVGVTLLAVAPLAYYFVSNGTPLLALLSWLGIQAVEPLPDWDLQVSGLQHRGLSHSLLAALVVGSVLGVSGWVLSGTVNDLLLAVPSVLSARLDQGTVVADRFSHVFTVLNLQPLTIPSERHVRLFSTNAIDRHVIALFGFVIGVYGIIVHLLGDVITVKGIQPFLPISHWRISLSPLRAHSPTANTGLFVLGVGAIIAAVVGAVP